ncbi:MAG: hypothetical protein L6V85_07590 [Clostridiales bacterium]|nr:MAG: hypothetical protein L6V85_07590 [Clostridiales bacterium]
MKKVLIGVLILIPIIIVASVLLTTNIISKNSYLPVDRVELNENYIEFSLDNGNTIDTLKATVYPRLAKKTTTLPGQSKNNTATFRSFTQKTIPVRAVPICPIKN